MKTWMSLLSLAMGVFVLAGPQASTADAHWRHVYYAPRRVVVASPVVVQQPVVVVRQPVVVQQPAVVASPVYSEGPVYASPVVGASPVLVPAYGVPVVRRVHRPRVVYAPAWGW
ncbi:MAG: hypothetical protein NT069_17485 [Planctomycetota bacterium]|nr:hypothetical protein [Planctomycetota bacterium]